MPHVVVVGGKRHGCRFCAANVIPRFIMAAAADMGIIIMDVCVFASKCVKVNSPTTLKARSQLDEKTVVCDRRNASKRIHVERIIGCAKTFTIMNTTVKSEETSTGGKIVCVIHGNECEAANRGYNLSHMNENMYTALPLVFISLQMMKHTSTAIIK